MPSAITGESQEILESRCPEITYAGTVGDREQGFCFTSGRDWLFLSENYSQKYLELIPWNFSSASLTPTLQSSLIVSVIIAFVGGMLASLTPLRLSDDSHHRRGYWARQCGGLALARI